MQRKKRKPRAQSKPRQQKQQGHAQQGAAHLAGQSALTPHATVIRVPRGHWGPLQYAQAAINALCQGGPPPLHVNKSQLTREVNLWLAGLPEYRATRYGELDRKTVSRALDTLRTANPLT